MAITRVVVAIIALIFCGALWAGDAEEQYQEGIHKMDVEGKLDEAIAIFQKVVESSKEKAPSLAAKALWQTAICYEKQGKKEEQTKTLQQIIDKFPKEEDLVKSAREKMGVENDRYAWSFKAVGNMGGADIVIEADFIEGAKGRTSDLVESALQWTRLKMTGNFGSWEVLDINRDWAQDATIVKAMRNDVEVDLSMEKKAGIVVASKEPITIRRNHQNALAELETGQFTKFVLNSNPFADELLIYLFYATNQVAMPNEKLFQGKKWNLTVPFTANKKSLPIVFSYEVSRLFVENDEQKAEIRFKGDCALEMKEKETRKASMTGDAVVNLHIGRVESVKTDITGEGGAKFSTTLATRKLVPCFVGEWTSAQIINATARGERWLSLTATFSEDGTFRWNVVHKEGTRTIQGRWTQVDKGQTIFRFDYAGKKAEIRGSCEPWDHDSFILKLGGMTVEGEVPEHLTFPPLKLIRKE